MRTSDRMMMAAALQGGIGRVYATFDPTRKHADVTLTNGNMTAAHSSPAYRNVFFNVDKTTELWAVEFNTTSTSLSGSNLIFPGIADNLTLDNYIGGFSNSLSYVPSGPNYGKFRNGVQSAAYWDQDQTTPFLVVFDPANRKIIVEKNGVLLASDACGGTAGPYIGMTIYNVIGSITVNTGATAFAAGHESLIAAYETANSVEINRGLWV